MATARLYNGQREVWKNSSFRGPWGWRPKAEGNPYEIPADRLKALNDSRVLIVDDSADVRELLTVLLTQYGVKVVAVASAEEALAAVKELRPDVLVSDIGMPDMDGYELIRQVRTLQDLRCRRLPAVALTAHARPEDRQAALASGYHMHIPKPVEPIDLLTSVANLLKLREEV